MLTNWRGHLSVLRRLAVSHRSVFIAKTIPKVLAPLTLGFLLSACVASSTPEQNLASVLSVSELEKSDGKAATRKKIPGRIATPKAAPNDTKTALASSDVKKSPSDKAAESVVRKENKTAALAAQKSKPKEKSRGFFSGNENNSLRVNRKKTSRKTTRRTSSRRRSGNSDLPGVRTKSLFGILGSGRKNYELDEPVEVASVASRARRGNFGLLLQTPSVQVGCFPRSLVRILKRVERRYGRTPIVTSGYRSRAKNRRIRGARNSVHISCKAADIQVKGVSKWQLAKYLRSIPGRGGVGTYCHTKSVHIDVGTKRDWNWRCRRGRRR